VGFPLAARYKIVVRLTVILLIALALRIGWALHQPTNPAALDALPDQSEYLQLGQNLLAGQGLQFTDPRFHQQVWAYRTPGYPFLVAACGADLRAIRVVQAILDSSTVLAVYLLARIWLTPTTSLIAAAIVAVNPFLIYFTGLILSETLFTAMLAWGMVLLIRVPAIGAAVLACAVMVRPSAIVLPALCAIALKGRKSLRLASLCVGMTLVILFAWGLRNHARLNAWIFTSTNSGITQYDGFNPSATGGSDQSFIRDMPELAQMDEVQRSQYLGGLAGQFIRDHPGTSAKLAALKILRLWSPSPLSAQFSRPLYVVVGLAYSVPLLIGTFIGLFTWPVRPAKALLLTPALYFTFIHAASVASLRYRLPAEPLMAIVAASIAGLAGKKTIHP
jgi:4-amino-4-deoxy-L-arabinose transferase-like glycosyltransferase